MNRHTKASALLCALALQATTFSAALAADSTRPVDVEIRRTSYGIPHIKADDYVSLGYGVGYAYAEDNVCLLADRIITVRGERSMFFGAQGRTAVGSNTVGNFAADVYFRSHINAALTQQFSSISREARQLIAGYVRGYNRYLADTPASQLPVECRNAAWVRPLSVTDVYLNLLAGATLASGGALVESIAFAAPPGSSLNANWSAAADLAAPPLGSNAIAIGKRASTNGRGVLLGNPHFPWIGALRFYQMHLTLPGRLNVMGAGLPGFPTVQIGFNEDIAWSHTVSTGTRFTLYQLALVAGNPTAYMYDGQVRNMERVDLLIPVKMQDDSVVDVPHTVYRSHFGPMVILPPAGLNWSTGAAFAMRDANIDNVRMVDQWLGMARATGIPSLRNALERNMGIPWVNTLAVDETGRAFYGDVSVKPNVDTPLFNACTQSQLAQALYFGAGLVLLNGTTSACEWRQQANAAPHALPPDELPAKQRLDYLQNSNDSYWLSNPANPMVGFSPVVGRTGVPQGFRTRAGLTQIADRLSNAHGVPATGFNDVRLQQLLFGNRNYAAELTVATFVPVCQANPLVTVDGTEVNIAGACAVLGNWDRRNDATSVGAHVFREWWLRVATMPGIFATPFSPADPVNTPRDLNVGNPSVRDALLAAFARGVKALNDNGIPLDAAWGDVFYQSIDGQRVRLHGGSDAEGVYNRVDPLAPGLSALTPAGYAPIAYGSSYMQTVGFDSQGPVAHGILSYSQSSHVESPHYADQTIDLFSRETWHRLPFREAQINADPNLSSRRLVEP